MLKVKDYAHVSSFKEMGKVLFFSEKDGVIIRAGQIFEARTVKGHTNLIVTGRVYDGYMYYFHGDKARKVKLDQFVKAVMSGDLQPRDPKEIDTERLSLATISIDAIANRRTGEEQIEYYGENAEERYLAGA